jgi:hypothetical protein
VDCRSAAVGYLAGHGSELLVRSLVLDRPT